MSFSKVEKKSESSKGKGKPGDENSSVVLSGKEDLSTAAPEEEEDKPPPVSFLPPETIKWMAKRRPGHLAGGRAQALVTPSRALQLKQIFRGLDFDGSGEISLEEMQDAIRYVAESDPSMNATKINNFFASMDTDGNGSIDFGEFLIAMSVDNGDTSSAEQSDKMQEAFFSFATNHRRQQLIERIDSKAIPVLERYHDFYKLFEFSTMPQKQNSNIADELQRAKQDAKAEKLEMGIEHWRARRKEFELSRRAHLFFEWSRKAENKDGSFNRLIKNSEILNPKDFSRRGHNILKDRMSKYSLNNDHTYMPPLKSMGRSPGLAVESMIMTQNLRKSQEVMAALPPVSMRAVAARSAAKRIESAAISSNKKAAKLLKKKSNTK